MSQATVFPLTRKNVPVRLCLLHLHTPLIVDDRVIEFRASGSVDYFQRNTENVLAFVLTFAVKEAKNNHTIIFHWDQVSHSDQAETV